MKKTLYLLLFIICIIYIIVSMYGLFSDVPINRPKPLTILLILSALSGAFYSFKKMKK